MLRLLSCFNKQNKFFQWYSFWITLVGDGEPHLVSSTYDWQIARQERRYKNQDCYHCTFISTHISIQEKPFPKNVSIALMLLQKSQLLLLVFFWFFFVASQFLLAQRITLYLARWLKHVEGNTQCT